MVVALLRRRGRRLVGRETRLAPGEAAAAGLEQDSRCGLCLRLLPLLPLQLRLRVKDGTQRRREQQQEGSSSAGAAVSNAGGSGAVAQPASASGQCRRLDWILFAV